MAIALLMISATMGIFKKSSTSHLLLLRTHSLLAQILIGESGIERIAFGDLGEDVAWVGIRPALAQAIGKRDQDLPVGLRTRQWTQRASNDLDMVIDVGHGAIFFREGHGRQ